MSASSDDIQSRLIDASEAIISVKLDEFGSDIELKIKLARILDLLAPDRDETEIVAFETAAHMTDEDAIKVADLICDLLYELM